MLGLMLTSACVGSSKGGSSLTGQSVTFSAASQPPASAVSKGSFTVWAKPENPKPLESYVVYTKISLPKGTDDYTAGDLKGSLVGTDGFAIPLGGKHNPYCHFKFSYKQSEALMTTNVPGAETSGIKDTIEITSDLLGETQEIQLVFGRDEAE